MRLIKTYMEISEDVYNADNGHYSNGYYYPFNDALKAFWIGLPNQNDPPPLHPPIFDDGFFARLYANRFTKETVVAYRGTVVDQHQKITTFENVSSDLKLGAGYWSESDREAIHFYQWAIRYLQQQNEFNKHPILTGHSLGGYLAQVVAIEYKQATAIVFNAPMLGDTLIPNLTEINNSFLKIGLTYLNLIRLKPVNALSGHLLLGKYFRTDDPYSITDYITTKFISGKSIIYIQPNANLPNIFSYNLDRDNFHHVG